MYPDLHWHIAAHRRRELEGEAHLRALACASHPGSHLSPREREVLAAVASGASDAEIARRLGLRRSAVRGHLSQALAKLGLHDRVQAVVFAYQSGLVPRSQGRGEARIHRPRRVQDE